MKNAIKGILTQSDDITRLKYLLAKDDIDDIQAAVVIVEERLKTEFPDLNIHVFAGKIEIKCESDKHYTILILHLKEEHLFMQYNEYGILELFNPETECDLELVRKIKAVILSLGFYKTGESKSQSGKFNWQNETYKIDVIRRKL